MKQLNEISQNLNITISHTASIQDILKKMLSNKKGAVILLKDEIIEGIITERDIIKIFLSGANLKDKAIDFATKNIISAKECRPLHYALHLMLDNNIRRVVIVDDSEKFKGIITQDDIIYHIEGDVYKTKLKAMHLIGGKNLITINLNTSILETLNIMSKNKISMLAVLKKSKLVGVVTESDILKLANSKFDLNNSIEPYISSPAITVHYLILAEDIVDIMREKNIRHIIVVDDNEAPIGVVTKRDILRNIDGSYSKFLENKLRYTKDTLNTLPQAIIEAYKLTNSEVIIHWANEKAKTIFGENLIDKAINRVLPNECKKNIIEKITKREMVKDEYVNFHGKAFKLSIFYFEDNIQLYFDDITHVENINKKLIEKISLYKKVENTLKKERNYIQNILDFQSNILLVIKENEIISCNKSFYNFFGYKSLEEFKNRHKCICELFIDADLDIKHNKKWLNIMMNNKNNKIENRVKILNPKDKNEHIFLIDSKPIPNKDSEFIVSFTDITKLEKYKELLENTNKELEKKVKERTWHLIEVNDELENSKVQLEEAQRIAHIGNWIIEVDTLKTFWSNEVYRIFGVEFNRKITFNDMINFFYEEDRELVKKVFDEAIENHSSIDFYARIKSGNNIKYIHNQAKIILNLNKAIKIFGTSQDITEAKELEKRQKKQEQLLIQQSKMASMGEMIGAIAHQWRQPLNVLGLIIQKLKLAFNKNKLNEEYLDDIVVKSMKQINFMSKTIDDFRYFFQPNKDKESFSLKEVINDTLSIISAQFDHHSIKVNLKEDKSLKILGYPNEFKQVILNILNNSKDAILEIQRKKPNFIGKIDIEIFEEKNITVIIKDNGGGVKEIVLNRIFEPYFTTKEQGQGTGIGLYMSKIIIEDNMNGILSVENIKEKDFKGAKFKIEFKGE